MLIDVLHRMLDVLTSAYNREENGNIGKLFRLYSECVEDADQALETVRKWRDVDQAEGTTLDRIGLTLGVPRGASDDAYYRLRIKIKMSSQLSGGTADTIISVVAVLLGIDLTAVRLYEVPGLCQVMLNANDLTDAQIRLLPDIAHIAKGALATGVGLKIYLSQQLRYYMPVQITPVLLIYSKLEVTIS